MVSLIIVFFYIIKRAILKSLANELWAEFSSMIQRALLQHEHLMNAESTAVYACPAESASV